MLLRRPLTTKQIAVGVAIGAATVSTLWILLRRKSRRPGEGVDFALYQYPSFVEFVKVTHAPADSDGWVRVDPADLAAEAGEALGLPGPLDVEISSLARMIYSETGDDAPAIEKAAVGWTAINEAAQRDWTLTRLFTYTRRYGDRGLYGTQEHGRFAATTRDPTDADVFVATMLLAGRWPDPTGGADQFYDPSDQQWLHDRCPADDDGHCLQPPSACPPRSGGRTWTSCYRSPEAIIAKWTLDEDGRQVKEMITVPGVDPEQQVFFRPIA